MSKELLPDATKFVQDQIVTKAKKNLLAQARQEEQEAQKALPCSLEQTRTDTLIAKVRFYIEEIREADKQVSAIMAEEYGKANLGRVPNFHDKGDTFYLRLSCSTQSLWTTIHFTLQALESSIEMQRESLKRLGMAEMV